MNNETRISAKRFEDKIRLAIEWPVEGGDESLVRRAQWDLPLFTALGLATATLTEIMSIIRSGQGQAMQAQAVPPPPPRGGPRPRIVPKGDEKQEQGAEPRKVFEGPSHAAARVLASLEHLNYQRANIGLPPLTMPDLDPSHLAHMDGDHSPPVTAPTAPSVAGSDENIGGNA